MRLRLIAALFGTLAACTAAAPAGHDWKTYANVRYAYQVCYPADVLKPQDEAPNGDGRHFASAGGATLSVWGSYPDGTLAADMAESVRHLTRDGGAITYKVVRPTWYVLSAQQGGTISYYRATLAGTRMATFEMRYPAAQKAAWDPVVGKIGGCLKMLDGPHYGKARG
jgi:hypothetical protein